MKKETRSHIHIEVTPLTFSQNPNEQELINKCKDIAIDIKRHVDNVDTINIRFEKEFICSFCGYSWEEDEETGMPQCCKKAQIEWRKSEEQHN